LLGELGSREWLYCFGGEDDIGVCCCWYLLRPGSSELRREEGSSEFRREEGILLGEEVERISAESALTRVEVVEETRLGFLEGL